MAPIERPVITQVSGGSLAQAMELSAQAGWNQLPADWSLFLKHGAVFGIFDGETLVSTAAIMPYGENFAWISMVLTRKAWRGRGFGTALLIHCISVLEAQGRMALLDATPAGEPLYRGLGFEDVYRLTRWQGWGGGKESPETATQADTSVATAVADMAFGTGRSALLGDFVRRCPVARRSSPDGVSHAFGRDGRLATQIGPVVGADEAAAAALIEVIVAETGGPVFLDIADRCKLVTARLEALGFREQRPFLRMKKGWLPAPGEEALTIAVAGPEFG